MTKEMRTMEEQQQQKEFVEMSVRGAPSKGGGGDAPSEEVKKMESQMAAQPLEQAFVRGNPMHSGGSEAEEKEHLEQQEQLEQVSQRTVSLRGGGATEPD
jgi:hypothetical protein